MKHIKRLIIIAVIMCLSLTTAYAVGVFPDTVGTKYEEASNTLMELEIMYGTEDGTFQPEAHITRAEMVVIMVRALGLSNFTAPGAEMLEEVPFSDIPLNYWCAEDIILAKDLGLINGKTPDEFDPEGKITGAEATKILINALGYSVVAETKGGYPEGYLVQAAALGVTNGMTVSPDEPITRGDVALMVFHALDVEILQSEGWSSEYGEILKARKGMTFASVKNGYYYGEGKVTATGITALTGESNLKHGNVKIGDTVFDAGETNAADYLGYNVKYYYEEDESGLLKLMSVRKTKSGREMVLDGALNKPKYSMSTGSYEYVTEASDKVKKVRVEAGGNTDIIYNGKACFNCTEAEMSPKEGTVTLIDAEGDGKYETVIIKDPKVYGFTMTEDNTIYVKGGQPITVENIKDEEMFILKDSDGNNVELSELTNGDVLQVYASKDGKYTEVILCLDEIYGTVTTIWTKDDETSIVVDGKEYPLSGNFYNSSNSALSNGLNGAFVLDSKGRIIYFTGSSERMEMGYLIQSTYKKDGLADDLLFRILTQNGYIEVITSANRITVDGYKKDAIDAYQYLVDNKAYEAQVIRFTRNKSGKMLTLDTTQPDRTNDEPALTKTKNAQSLMWRSAINSFGKLVMGENAVIFAVPKSDVSNMDDYSVVDAGRLSNTATYTVDVYSIEHDFLIDAVVVDAALVGAPFDQETSEFAIVTGIIEVLSAEGDVRTEVSLMNGSGVVSKCYYDMADEANIAVTGKTDVLGVGDVVCMAVNNRSEGTLIHKYYDSASNSGFPNVTGRAFGGTTADSQFTRFRVGLGYVYGFHNNLMKYIPATTTSVPGKADSYGTVDAPSFTDVNDVMEIYTADTFKVIVYDKNERKGRQFRTGAYKEICDFEGTGKSDLVLIQTRDGVPKSMVIIKD